MMQIVTSNILKAVLILTIGFCSPLYAQDVQQGEAAEGSDLSGFCQWGQELISNTDVEAENVIYDVFSDFTASKAFLDETQLIIRQYIEYEERDGVQTPKLVSCKVKSVDHLNKVRGEGTASDAQYCKIVHEKMVAKLSDELNLSEPPNVIFDEDETVWTGSNWIKPWPYQVAYEDDNGVLHLRAKGLYVPYAWYIPMPARFKGVQYCHLAAPNYLRALLTGAREP